MFLFAKERNTQGMHKIEYQVQYHSNFTAIMLIELKTDPLVKINNESKFKLSGA